MKIITLAQHKELENNQNVMLKYNKSDSFHFKKYPNLSVIKYL